MEYPSALETLLQGGLEFQTARYGTPKETPSWTSMWLILRCSSYTQHLSFLRSFVVCFPRYSFCFFVNVTRGLDERSGGGGFHGIVMIPNVWHISV